MSKNFTGTSGSIWPILIPAIITSGAIILQLNRLMLRESRLPLQSPRDYCQSEKQIRPDSIQCSYHPHLTYLLSLPSHSLSVIDNRQDEWGKSRSWLSKNPWMPRNWSFIPYWDIQHREKVVPSHSPQWESTSPQTSKAATWLCQGPPTSAGWCHLGEWVHQGA